MKSSDQIEDVRKSKSLEKIQANIPGYIASAKSLEVKNEDDRQLATVRLTAITKGLKELEKLRKQFVKPIKDSAKAIDAFFKEKAAPLKEADDSLRGKIGVYLDEQDRLRQEREAAEAAEHASKTSESETWGTAKPAAPVAIAAPPKMEKTSARKVLNIEVVNIEKVPIRFLLIDEMAIKAAWKDGIKEIPGLKLTEKNALTVR